uniref:Transmembrane protein n=1 Tax=viral metagenome TaxID=1070528 RepID=A0A6C0BQB3_9ZZZZ
MDPTHVLGGKVNAPDKSILSSIFSMDAMEKDTLFNLVQYVILSIIPIMLLLRGLTEYIPEEEEHKSSIEILAEIFIEIVVIVLSLWFINKVIMHIPTYSQSDYPDISLFSGMIPLIFMLMILQSKFSKKINILFDRIYTKEGMCSTKQVALPPAPDNISRTIDVEIQRMRKPEDVNMRQHNVVNEIQSPPQDFPVASNDNPGNFGTWP